MGTRPHFRVFSTFQTLDYRISKNVQANRCGFIRDNKKGPVNKCVSLKYMKLNGRGNDLKRDSFLVIFKLSRFEIQSPFLARHHV